MRDPVDTASVGHPPAALRPALARWLLPVVLITAAAPVTTQAQQHGIRFDHLGVAQGLSQRVVTAILHDRTGFMWFGTQGGLNRYDGHEFRILDHAVGDSTSLADNYVKVIHEGAAGRLWVGTQSGGLGLLNDRHDAFHNFQHRDGDPTSLSHNGVFAIAEDDRGQLFVGTFGGGVNRFDPETGRFALIPVAGPHQRETDLITALEMGSDGTLWVGTEGAGALRLVPGDDSIRVVPYRNPGAARTDNNIRDILVAPTGVVWLGRDDGLYYYEPDGSVFERVPGAPSWTTGGGTIVTELLPTVLGRIWIGTYGEGLHQLDTRRGTYSVVARPGEPDGIADDRVYRLYRDRNHHYWISVWGAGVHRVRGLSGLFALATHNHAYPGTLSSSDITTVHVDRQGRLLVGTFDGGLNISDPARTSFHALRRGHGPRDLPSDQVARIAEDPQGRIWVGFWEAGLTVIDGERVVRRYRADPDDPNALPSNRIRSLLTEPDGTVWIGSLRGVARFEPETESFTPVPVTGEVFALCRTADGMLWAGTLDGLVEFNPVTGGQRRFRPDLTDPGAISHAAVADLFETPNGTLWAATRGGGLNRVVRSADGTVRFEAVTELQGLADNDAVGVAGQDDVLWITSKNGLSRYEVSTGTFTNFRETDGLPSADFATGAVLMLRDTLYLGTGRGLIMSAIGGSLPDEGPSPVIITSIETAGRTLTLDAAPWEVERIQVHYGDVLSIEMAILEYAERPEHRYQYRLGGPEDPWVNLRKRPSVSFASLAPGIHVFTSRGRNHHGIESETPPLVIEVTPPLWMTAWFRLLVILGAAGLLVAIYRRRTASIRQHNAMLTESRQRMRQLATGIEDAREAERTRIAREIHDEFGQTLTSLKLDCQWLRRRVTDDGSTAGRIGAMMELIDTTAREVRRIGAELRPSVLDNLGLVAAAQWQAREFQGRTGINARVEGDEIQLDSDRSTALFRILQEALTNVARHAAARHVRIALHNGDETVTLTVEDDGRGFSGRPSGKRAFGLIGMQERAETWGGTLEVDGTPGRGTRVTVRIPMRAPAPTG